MSQDVLQSCLWLEAGSDAQWSQHSSDCLGGAVHVRDDHCGIWGGGGGGGGGGGLCQIKLLFRSSVRV